MNSTEHIQKLFNDYQSIQKKKEKLKELIDTTDSVSAENAHNSFVMNKTKSIFPDLNPQEWACGMKMLELIGDITKAKKAFDTTLESLNPNEQQSFQSLYNSCHSSPTLH